MNFKLKTALLMLILTFFGLTFFGLTFFSASATGAFGQKNIKPKDVIVIELTVGSGTNTQIIQVPISTAPKTTEKPLKRGWEKDGDGTLPPQFSYNLEAYFNDKNSSKVYFAAVVERCQETIQKDFIVTKNQKSEMELGCGIKITAYYGLESKDKSFLLKSKSK